MAVWFVKPLGMGDEEVPRNIRGVISETEIDGRVKDLLLKYPEPRYLVDGGETVEEDGRKAAEQLYRQTCKDEEE